MNERLSAEVMSTLLCLLAHDLRNPLSALQSNVSYLSSSEGLTSQDEREAVDDARASCDCLAHLIDGLDLLARALAKDEIPSASPTPIAAVARDVLVRHRSIAASHDVRLEIAPSAADGRQRVTVHAELFTRAVGCLVRNGIQHTRAGGAVRIIAWRGDARCGLLVVDEGPRLGSEYLELAFSAEGQDVAKNRAEGRYSRGLGLYCARLSARLAGAEVTVAEPPAGSTNAFVASAPSVRG